MIRWTTLRLVPIALLTESSAAVASETTTYSYDALGRVVAVSRSGGASAGANSTYTYDPAGNRAQVTTSGAPALLLSQDSSEQSQTQETPESALSIDN